MTAWLCILNRANFEVVKRTNVWGVSERHKNQPTKSKIGDKCVFYMLPERSLGERTASIGGVFEIISAPYFDDSLLFGPHRDPEERFPFRVRIKPIEIYQPELPFAGLVSLFKFITNKQNYGGHLLGKAMRQIPEEDLELIIKKGHKFKSK